MSNVTFITAAESAATNEIAGLVVHDFARQADDELAGRGVPAWCGWCAGGAITLQCGSLAA